MVTASVCWQKQRRSERGNKKVGNKEEKQKPPEAFSSVSSTELTRGQSFRSQTTPEEKPHLNTTDEISIRCEDRQRKLEHH